MKQIDYDITITIDYTKKLAYKGSNTETATKLLELALLEKKVVFVGSVEEE